MGARPAASEGGVMTHQRDLDGRVSRRTLLRGAAGLGLAVAGGTLLPGCSTGGDDRKAAAAAKLGTSPRGGGVEPPPETTTIRLPNIFPNSCAAALALAEPFLREEGFTDVRYPKFPMNESVDALPAGELDMHLGYAATHLLRIDAGAPVVMLGGLHVGCWQVFAGAKIRSMRGLKGKKIGIISPTGPDGMFLAITLANVGIDLRKDVQVVNYVATEAAEALASGRVDALAAFPPFSQDLRARRIGTVVVDSMVDRPWSNYYCCMATVNRDWMERHPMATAQPDHAAHVMVDGGFTDNLAYATQNLQEIPYDVWRRFDPADTVRYLALRMREAGLVKGTPAQLLARGTDFSHLAELTRQMKGA
jgi:NitT/TauT family transport system substrate-binding protein